MKKIYLSILCLSAFSITSFGQSTRQFNELKVRGTEEMRTAVKPSTNNVEKSTPLWEDDFSTGANWTFANTSTPAGDWVISTSTAPAIGFNTGAWQDTAAVSDENGYALFDSDLVGANGGNQNATITYVGTPIVLTGFPNVTIDFRQRIRKFTNTQTFVGVSVDAGATWTDFPLNVSLPSSVVRENTESINVSVPAGGAAAVLVRFQYIGSWDYLWAVDDVAIYEQPANDVQILSAYFSGSTNQGVEYGRTIINHADASYLVGVEVYNFGTAAQTNVSATANYAPLMSNFAFGTIPAGATVSLENTETPTLAVGVYPGVFSALSTEETMGDFFDNNSFNRYVEFTTNEYSQDGIGVYPTADLALTSLGTNSFTGGEDGLRLATMYHIKETDDFWALKIMLANGTDVNSYVIATVIDTTGFLANPPDFTPILTSTEYFITAADTTQGYATVPFTSLGSLSPGAYYASIECFSDNDLNNIRVLDDQTVPQPGLASAIYIPADQVYSNGIAIGIRLLAGTAGIDGNDLEGVNIYPNPSSGIVNISNDLNVENTITVLDLTGKKVATKVVSSSTQFDLSSMGSGVYFFEISNVNGKKVERVVIR